MYFEHNGRLVESLETQHRTSCKVIKTIQGPPNWKNKPLVVPLTPPTIGKCRPIKVSYTLEVSLNNHSVEMPIVIGTIPYRGPEGSSMPTPDDPTAIDFVRENCIQYQAIHYASQQSTSPQYYMPIYGYVHQY